MAKKPPWHILLIEDNAEDCAELRRMLLLGGSRRYRFSEARLGADGVRQVLQPQDGPVDCVLLDYDLPDMDAHGVLAALCGESGTPPCPVVVVTGTALEEGLHLLGAGAQDYIGKRWTSPDSLTRAVENAVERYALLANHRAAQEALRASEERYRSLFNSIDAGYAVLELSLDEAGAACGARFLQVNPAFERQTGLHDAVGRSLQGLLPGSEHPWLQACARVAATGVPLRMEQHAEAWQRWFDLYAFRLGPPQARQVAVLFYDTTERKRTELALRAAQAEAEAANRAKSDFLLSMSHELRSPLSAMLGFTQLIEAGTPPPTPAQQDSVEQILGAGWYLLGLINEILDLSAIESGRTVLSPQPVSLQQVLDDCEGMVEPQAQASGIRVACPSLQRPCFVLADPTRVKQVLINLLSNAIKYNRPGGQVTVRCSLVAGQRVRIGVEDTGAGLSADQVAALFQPFNRLGREAGSEPGTGIGLVICQRLVALMGGRIGVDSTPGAGSCFWFELAVTDPPTSDRPAPRPTLLCIAEEASPPLDMAAVLARWPGACLLRARDIQAGLKMARSARPDVVLVHVGPHDPGGRQAMRLLARDPRTARTPVIALAAGAAPADVAAGLAAGYASVLTQVEPGDAFIDALDLAFQPRPAAGRPAAALENA